MHLKRVYFDFGLFAFELQVPNKVLACQKNQKDLEKGSKNIMVGGLRLGR